MQLTSKIDDREVTELLRRLKSRVASLKPVMTEIGLYYERRVLENFKAEQSPDGKPWARLSAATIMMKLGQKTKKGRYGFNKDGGLSAKGKRYITGKRILWEHGDLEGSIHSQADNNSVTIGTGGHIPYAAVHQFGIDETVSMSVPAHLRMITEAFGRKTKFPVWVNVKKHSRNVRMTIPARPYLAVNEGEGLTLADKDRDMIVELLTDHLTDGL